jgi:hypothetical protein
MDEEWKKALADALEKIETIGFFAAIGMHFAESTPLLSEELGEHLKGTPWERFSSTDQCFKMIHQLATKSWRNLEGIASFVEPQVEGKRDLVKEIIEPEEAKSTPELPPSFQTLTGEMRRLKNMGETIVALAGDEKRVSELDHERVKNLGEMIIDTTTAISENLQKESEKYHHENSGGEAMKDRMEKPLELIGEEINRIKAFGSCLVAMGMAFHDGFKLNPRQIETLGQMIVDLVDQVTEKLNHTEDSLPPSLP